MENINNKGGHHFYNNGCGGFLSDYSLHSKGNQCHQLRQHLGGKGESKHHVPQLKEKMKQEDIENSLFPNISEVNIKLDPSAFSEIQWIGEPETGLMIQGSARITVLNEDGDARMTDLQVGDIWDFMPGYRYSIKILDKGCVFKLYLKNCNLPENKTFGYQIDGNLYIKL